MNGGDYVESEYIGIIFYDELVPHEEGVALVGGMVIFPEDMIQSVDYINRTLYVIAGCRFFDKRELWVVQWNPYFAVQIPAQKIKDFVVCQEMGP